MTPLSKILVAASVCLPLSSVAHGGDELAVITHPDTPVDALDTTDLRPIFQTNKTALKGDKVLPLNLPGDDAARRSFDRAVLGLEPDRVAHYWINRKIRGGNPPPTHISKADLVVRIVARKKGAIGYVPMSAVTSGVKVIGKVRGGVLLSP